MKTCLMGVLIGATISLAVPAAAQQKMIADPQLLAQINAHSKGWDSAFNANSTAAVMALYTDDAVEVGNQGPIVGKEALTKRYDELTKVFHVSNHTSKVYHSFMIDEDGKTVWSDGEYTFTAQYKDEKPAKFKGYWSAISVREGDVWKDRMQTWNVEPSPGPTPTPADVAKP